MDKPQLLSARHECSSPVIEAVNKDSNCLRNKCSPCNAFSMRGYVHTVREVNIEKCWPFKTQPKKGLLVGFSDSFLPPIEVPRYRYWECLNCIEDTPYVPGCDQENPNRLLDSSLHDIPLDVNTDSSISRSEAGTAAQYCLVEKVIDTPEKEKSNYEDQPLTKDANSGGNHNIDAAGAATIPGTSSLEGKPLFGLKERPTIYDLNHLSTELLREKGASPAKKEIVTNSQAQHIVSPPTLYKSCISKTTCSLPVIKQTSKAIGNVYRRRDPSANEMGQNTMLNISELTQSARCTQDVETIKPVASWDTSNKTICQEYPNFPENLTLQETTCKKDCSTAISAAAVVEDGPAQVAEAGHSNLMTKDLACNDDISKTNNLQKVPVSTTSDADNTGAGKKTSQKKMSTAKNIDNENCDSLVCLKVKEGGAQTKGNYRRTKRQKGKGKILKRRLISEIIQVAPFQRHNHWQTKTNYLSKRVKTGMQNKDMKEGEVSNASIYGLRNAKRKSKNKSNIIQKQVLKIKKEGCHKVKGFSSKMVGSLRKVRSSKDTDSKKVRFSAGCGNQMLSDKTFQKGVNQDLDTISDHVLNDIAKFMSSNTSQHIVSREIMEAEHSSREKERESQLNGWAIQNNSENHLGNTWVESLPSGSDSLEVHESKSPKRRDISGHAEAVGLDREGLMHNKGCQNLDKSSAVTLQVQETSSAAGTGQTSFQCMDAASGDNNGTCIIIDDDPTPDNSTIIKGGEETYILKKRHSSVSSVRQTKKNHNLLTSEERNSTEKSLQKCKQTFSNDKQSIIEQTNAALKAALGDATFRSTWRSKMGANPSAAPNILAHSSLRVQRPQPPISASSNPLAQNMDAQRLLQAHTQQSAFKRVIHSSAGFDPSIQKMGAEDSVEIQLAQKPNSNSIGRQCSSTNISSDEDQQAQKPNVTSSHSQFSSTKMGSSHTANLPSILMTETEQSVNLVNLQISGSFLINPLHLQECNQESNEHPYANVMWPKDKEWSLRTGSNPDAVWTQGKPFSQPILDNQSALPKPHFSLARESPISDLSTGNGLAQSIIHSTVPAISFTRQMESFATMPIHKHQHQQMELPLIQGKGLDSPKFTGNAMGRQPILSDEFFSYGKYELGSYIQERIRKHCTSQAVKKLPQLSGPCHQREETTTERKSNGNCKAREQIQKGENDFEIASRTDSMRNPSVDGENCEHKSSMEASDMNRLDWDPIPKEASRKAKKGKEARTELKIQKSFLLSPHENEVDGSLALHATSQKVSESSSSTPGLEDVGKYNVESEQQYMLSSFRPLSVQTQDTILKGSLSYTSSTSKSKPNVASPYERTAIENYIKRGVLDMGRPRLDLKNCQSMSISQPNITDSQSSILKRSDNSVGVDATPQEETVILTSRSDTSIPNASCVADSLNPSHKSTVFSAFSDKTAFQHS